MVTAAGPVAPVTGETTMQCLKSLVFFNEAVARMHNSMSTGCWPINVSFINAEL